MNQKKKIGGDGLYKFFIYFVLIALAVSIVIPVGWVFMASIKENSEFYGNPWALPLGFYWQNFVDAWNAANMGEYMINSVIVTALALGILLVTALPASYALARFQFKGSKFLNAAFMGGLFINVNYIVVPIFLMLRDGNAWTLQVFGEGLLLNNLFVLAIVYAATALPFTIYLLSGYFVTLPHDFEEAAYIDGAGFFRTFFTVILPVSRPCLATAGVMQFLLCWNEFQFALTLTTGLKSRTMPIALYYFTSQFASDYGAMFAATALIALPSVLIYCLLQEQVVAGLTSGAVKG